jgi:hypothetical protein
VKKLTDHQSRGVQSLHQVITDLWDELTFEDVQAVFLEWINRLSSVIENKAEPLLNDNSGFEKC